MHTPFRTFFFISTLLLCILAKPNKQELCQFITQDSQNPNDNSITQLSINSLSVIQDSCVKYFSLDLTDPTLEGKYVIIELNFYALPDELTVSPKLLQKMNSRPRIYLNSQSNFKFREDANTSDSNAFLNRKLYHHIILTPEQLKHGEISYFAVYKVSSAEEEYFNGQISYDINVKTSSTFPCPQDCSGNGICNQEQKKCICNEGFFDLDCSVQAIPLILDSSATQSIDTHKWEYFYFRMESELKDIQLKIAKSGGRVKFSFLTGNIYNFLLPNFYRSDGFYTLSSQENHLGLSITRPLISDHNERQAIIGVYNIEDEPVTVSIMIELFDVNGMTKTTILFGITGVFLGLAAFLSTLIFIKYRFPGRIRTWTENEGLKKPVCLTKEEVEKYFPEADFSHFKSSFPQTLCSICLEDFKEDSSCRKLYCEHIYHGDCIDAWVIKQDSCPNCKKTITKEAIEAHLSTLGQSDEEQKMNADNDSHLTLDTSRIEIIISQQPDNEQACLISPCEKV